MTCSARPGLPGHRPPRRRAGQRGADRAGHAGWSSPSASGSTGWRPTSRCTSCGSATARTRCRCRKLAKKIGRMRPELTKAEVDAVNKRLKALGGVQDAGAQGHGPDQGPAGPQGDARPLSCAGRRACGELHVIFAARSSRGNIDRGSVVVSRRPSPTADPASDHLRLVTALGRRLDGAVCAGAVANAARSVRQDQVRADQRRDARAAVARARAADRGRPARASTSGVRAEPLRQTRTSTVPGTRSCTPRWSRSQISAGTARHSSRLRTSASSGPGSPPASRWTRSPSSRCPTVEPTVPTSSEVLDEEDQRAGGTPPRRRCAGRGGSRRATRSARTATKSTTMATARRPNRATEPGPVGREAQPDAGRLGVGVQAARALRATSRCPGGRPWRPG